MAGYGKKKSVKGKKPFSIMPQMPPMGMKKKSVKPKKK